MANSADPDQLASSEANWSGYTMFAKAGYIRVQQDYGKLCIFQGFCKWTTTAFVRLRMRRLLWAFDVQVGNKSLVLMLRLI